MANYLNFVTLAYPRNGTATTAADPTNAGSVATVIAGSVFTPTAGRLLLCIMEGAVSSTTPSGWTLPTNGSAVNNTGLYVWYRTAAGSDTVSSTHNGSNYPIVVTFIEYASGAAFVKAASGTTGIAYSVANPALSGLTGTNDLWAIKGGDMASGYTMTGSTWSGTPTPTQLVTTSVAFSTTDGYYYNLANAAAATATSWTPTDTITGSNLISPEMLTFAVSYPAGATNYTGTPSDAVGVTDGVTASFGPQANPVDPVGVTDTASTARSVSVAVSDTVGVTDIGAPISLAYDYSLNDPVGVTDSAVDVVAVIQGPADTVGATDTLNDAIDVVRASSDPVGVTDAVSANVTGGGSYTGNPADPVGVSDAVLAQLDRVVTVADLLSLVDNDQPALGPVANPSDPVGVTDSLGWSAAVAPQQADPVSVTDTATTVLTRVVTLADVAGIVDAVTTQANLPERDITVYVSGPTRHPLRDASPLPNPLRVSGGTR